MFASGRNEYVIVRSKNSVVAGELFSLSSEGLTGTVNLVNSRRILPDQVCHEIISEIATNGISKWLGQKVGICPVVPRQIIFEVFEIVFCSSKAEKDIREAESMEIKAAEK